MAARTDSPHQDDTPRADPADRLSSAAPDPDDAPAGGGLNVMSVVTRRWPLILVGVVGGLVFGFLFHLQRQPLYESKAQVLVIKKRAESAASGTNSGGMDSRQQYVEDYVTTQVTLLKSEHILKAAGRKLTSQEARTPLPPTDLERAAFIASRLTVSRDREPGAAGLAAGSGVLNLTFRDINPETTKVVLRVVIEAYQDELIALYDEASRTRLKTIEDFIQLYKRTRDDLNYKIGVKKDALRQITQEDIANIRARLTDQGSRQTKLEEMLIDLDDKLGVARGAGTDRRKRRDAAYMLGQLARMSSTTDPVSSTAPEVVLRRLQLQREELSARFGRDHPTMRAHDGQIKMVKSLTAGGSDKGDGNDEDVNELWPIQQRLLHEKGTADRQLVQIKSVIARDRDILNHASKVQDEIVALTDRVADNEKDLRAQEQSRMVVEATSQTGGFSAKTINDPATGWKVAPVITQSLMFGAVLGALAGGGLGVLAELSDQGFRSPADVRRRLGLPIIGHLPQLNPLTAMENSDHPGIDPNIVIAHKPKSTEAEAYRGVRTQLYFSTQGRGHQVIQMTSPNPGDGKSTLTANLAASIAQSGKRVVLVDCDFRKPRVHKMWNLANPEVGMSTVVAGEADLAAAVQKSEVRNLDLLPCGPRPANPAELLTSPGFVDCLNKLRASYDFVLLDTPPMLAVSDPSVVAPRADGVIMVLRMSKKARPAAVRARELLAAVGANVIGVAVNGIGSRSGGDYGYGGYGGYGYSYGYQYRYQYEYEYEYADEYADSPEDAAAIDAKGPAARG